jgi:hypothetical protein
VTTPTRAPSDRRFTGPAWTSNVMDRLLPDAELHVYHGGHLWLLTEAGELAPVVDRFLRGAPF